ncbi:MAG: hypothetical protein HQM15_05660 [Deltaproteobacteria bacterium]|nr:hypothetical protein [Deltaproteobacteria bacterium]
MAHKTILNWDEEQYSYLKKISKSEKLSIPDLLKNWVDEKRKKRKEKKYFGDSLFKMKGIFNSGKKDVGEKFDDYLYGNKKW